MPVHNGYDSVVGLVNFLPRSSCFCGLRFGTAASFTPASTITSQQLEKWDKL